MSSNPHTVGFVAFEPAGLEPKPPPLTAFSDLVVPPAVSRHFMLSPDRARLLRLILTGGAAGDVERALRLAEDGDMRGLAALCGDLDATLDELEADRR